MRILLLLTILIASLNASALTQNFKYQISFEAHDAYCTNAVEMLKKKMNKAEKDLMAQTYKRDGQDWIKHAVVEKVVEMNDMNKACHLDASGNRQVRGHIVYVGNPEM